MKLSNVFLIFFAGVAGVLFGGLFLTIILPRFFSGELETGDMATWAAAFGTICTLGFLINQHTELREKQQNEKKEFEIERDKREEHECKQQEMWASQEKMFSFQKYQEHRTLFFRLLDSLETTIPIEFLNKAELYEAIFPNNSLSQVQLTLDKSTTPQPHVLKQVEIKIIRCNRHLVKLSHQEYSVSDDLIAWSHDNIADLLKLKLTSEPKVGDLRYHQEKSLNLLQVFDVIDTFCEVLNKINKFVDWPSLDLCGDKNVSSLHWASVRLQEIYLTHDHNGYNVNRGPHDVLDIVYIFSSNLKVFSPALIQEKVFNRLYYLSINLIKSGADVDNLVITELKALNSELLLIKNRSDLSQEERNVLETIYRAIPSGSDLNL